MDEESTQQYLRIINVNEKLISSIDKGILILDNELRILYYNELLQTLINIIKNSIEAFKENTHAEKKLHVNVYEENSHLLIEINDNAE